MSKKHFIYDNEVYYPFGMQMPGRVFSDEKGYTFGFNGKLKDNDIEGDGNWEDYGMRDYLPRLGKFASVDPLTKKFPFYSTYQFAGNKPVIALDLDGLEEYVVIRWYDAGSKYTGSTVFKITDSKDRLQQTGTLIINRNSAGQERVTSDLQQGKFDKKEVFRLDDHGDPASLSGGKILSESPNERERMSISKVDRNSRIKGAKTVETLDYKPLVIPFDDPSNVKPVDERVINSMKMTLNNNPDYTISITGHASTNDNVPESTNQSLSDQRAQSITNQLVNDGISADRVINDGGKGSTQPLNTNSTEPERRKNRRGEVKLTVPKNAKYN